MIRLLSTAIVSAPIARVVLAIIVAALIRAGLSPMSRILPDHLCMMMFRGIMEIHPHGR
jgi:hypothetical protein